MNCELSINQYLQSLGLYISDPIKNIKTIEIFTQNFNTQFVL
ncbi:hypothetical protein pb186bvf_020260 [Paramecium bursaria]